MNTFLRVTYNEELNYYYVDVFTNEKHHIQHILLAERIHVTNETMNTNDFSTMSTKPLLGFLIVQL